MYNAFNACVDSACATYCDDAGVSDAGAPVTTPTTPTSSKTTSDGGCNASSSSRERSPFGVIALGALCAFAAFFWRKARAR